MASSFARLAGALHNYALDAVAFKADYPNTSQEQDFETILKFADARLKEYSPGSEINLTYTQATALYQQYYATPNQILPDLLDQGTLSRTQFDLLTAGKRRAENTILRVNDATMTQLLALDIQALQDFATEASLAEAAQDVVVGTLSVVLHSNLYWVNVALDENNKRYGEGTSEGAAARFNWWDAAGFLLGYGLGGGGPIGVGTGIALGTFFSNVLFNPDKP